MNRKEFFKTGLKAGTCACALLFLGGKDIAFADSDSQQDKYQGFVSNWTENLMKIMDKHLDEETKTKIMEESGRKCAEKSYKQIALQYKGNVDGLMARMRQNWAEIADFDKEKGIIRVVGKKNQSCDCPMARGKTTLSTGTLCLCSRGWVKEVFETVTGEKVDVVFEKTRLTGADHCAYKIIII